MAYKKLKHNMRPTKKALLIKTRFVMAVLLALTIIGNNAVLPVVQQVTISEKTD